MGEFAFQTLRESITSAIRSKILTGELQPGVKLAEQKLAEEFGSSRAPIREALRQLEQEGMVEYSRNVGCSVRRVKPEDAYEIYLLRANLEMTALRYFDCKFPEEDLRTLRGILEEMRIVALLDKVEAEQLTDIFIVIDDQNFFVCHLGFLPQPHRAVNILIILHNCGQKKNRNGGL